MACASRIAIRLRHAWPLTLLAGAVLLTPVAASASETVLGQNRAQQCYDYAMLRQAPRSATDICTRAIEGDPMRGKDLAATYSNRGLLLARRQRFDAALSDHSRALELDPLNVHALINRANTFTRMKRYQDALRDYEVADFYAQGRNPLIYYNRSLTYERMGRKADAREDLIRAVQLNPDSKRFREALATLE